MSRVESLVVLPRIFIRHIVSRMLLPGAALLSRLFLGGVFLWSSLSKLQQPYDFLFAVYQYELVGPQLGLWVATTVPWLELATGICLILGIWEWGAWVVTVALLSMFTVALYSVANRGLLIPCGCACTPIEVVSYRSVLNTGFLLLASLIGFGCSLAMDFLRSHFPESPFSSPSSSR
jgi:putative oxidoreductase